MHQHLLHCWSSLTHWLIETGDFSRLTVLPLLLSVSLINLEILEGLVSLEGLVGLVVPVSYISLVNSMHDFTICIICALHNFQFYLAHLWTDFQSCLIVTVRSSAYYATDTCQIENNVAWLQKTVIWIHILWMWEGTFFFNEKALWQRYDLIQCACALYTILSL